MSVYWNDKTRRLVPYIPGEQPRDRNFVKLNTNENPYPPSPAVVKAVREFAGENLRLYPDPVCLELRETIAARYGLAADQVFAGNGSDEILAFAFAAFFGGGEPLGETQAKDVLVFPDITYSFYPVYAGLWDVPYRSVPLKPDFTMDISDYLEKSGGIIFPNPNAPTGIAIPLAALREIAGAAERDKRVVVVDEAYIAFADEEGMGSAIPLVSEFPNLLVIRTLSKEASLAGLRSGYALGSHELIEGLCRVRDSFNSYTLDRLALAGSIAAIKDVPYYEGINRRIIATRHRVAAGLEARGFRVLPSQANFLFAAPPPECGKSGQEFYAGLRERGVLVRHFNKPRIADFLRISMGTDEEMNVFLSACENIINQK
ncbi:MAG: aminotransferase class I/II-fold pyridoxal phosphate-dependent enzyme [Treponema sp.]|nr:aminotransferase class I/II-fold pyridoxal phosphate-dependent enzyme [Treponema sp.]